MAKIMQPPAAAQRGAGPGEHRPGRVVRQRPERPPQRPPQRVVGSRRHQPVHLLLVEPQPHERIRGGRQRLQRPRPLADHGDQLLTRVGVRAPGAEQLSGAGAGGHPERHQCPVPVRHEPGEQLIELLIRDLPRDPPRCLRPVPPGVLSPERLHRAAVRIRPAPPATGQRERVHHRPGASLQVEIVETPQHRLAVRRRRRRVPRVRHRTARLAGELNPAAEVPGLRPGGLIPSDTGRSQEAEPAQQVHRIRPLRGRRAPACLQVAQIRRRRRDGHAVGINDPVRLERVPCPLNRTRSGNHQRQQIPRPIPIDDHEHAP
jgi:hypothetical protein